MIAGLFYYNAAIWFNLLYGDGRTNSFVAPEVTTICIYNEILYRCVTMGRVMGT